MTPARGGSPLHVIIAGGGLGGLCLAQSLHRSGVSAAVHERDDSAHSRDQGYRISLKGTGAQALRACLPPHLYQLAQATAIRQARLMSFMDDQLVPRFAKDIPPATDGGFGVNRRTLREILLAELPGVRFGRACRGYAATADGRVEARFDDGSTETGDLLVGADGTGSAVRAQLLPDAGHDDLGWALYGRTPLTPELLAATPDVLVDSFNRVVAADGSAFAVATCRPVTPYAEAVARFAPQVRLTPIQDCFSWTMTVHGPLPRGVDAAGLHALATRTVAGFHPAVRRIVAEADAAATFPVVLSSARPVGFWREPAVTLLGDAVHTMSPGRGDGANIALRDASLLGALLSDAARGAMPLLRAKQEYEAQMLDYGFAAVEQSRTAPFAPPRPVGGGALGLPPFLRGPA